MLESDFSKDVIKAVKARAAYVVNIHGHLMQKSGLPDLHIMHRNWTGWLELKCEDYEASTLQRIVSAKIQLRGIPAYVLRCRENLVAGINFGKGNQIYNYTLESFAGDIIKQVPKLEELLGVLVEVEGKYHDAERQLALEIKKLQNSLTNTRLSNSAGWHDLTKENEDLKATLSESILETMANEKYKDYSYYVGGEITCNRTPLKFCAWADLMKKKNEKGAADISPNDNDNDGPVGAPWLVVPE